MTVDRFALETLADQLGGSLQWPDNADTDARFSHLATDSRKLRAASRGIDHTVFIALRGARHDGHDHLAAVRAEGVKAFVVRRDWTGSLPGAIVLRVPDTLLALQQFGAFARFSRPGKVIGITGSNGKTTVKEWAHALAGQDRRISRSPGSWNSQVGVPLSLWSLDDQADFHLVEAGISHPGEMAALARIIRPEIGVFVHFGDAHGAHFPDAAAKAREKLRLFEGTDTLVLGTEHSDVMSAIEDLGWTDRCVRWSLDPNSKADLTLSMSETGAGCTLEGVWKGTPIQWTLPFSDRASVGNALTAALLLLELGWTPDALDARLSALRPVGMRLEHLEGRGGGVILNDTWNHDLDGLSTALDALERIPGGRRRAVILSDIVPFDAGDEAQCARLRDAIGLRKVDRWIAVGPELAAGIPGVTDVHAHHPDVDTLLGSGDLTALEGWDVLVKGARPFGFERVSDALEANSHTTVLDLDLGRLAHNLDRFRDRFGKPIMGMVKAFAYGAGDAVAVELDRLGIDRLAVAFTEEGVALRKRGVRCPILVLNADARRYADLIEWDLEPEVHRLEDLDRWADALRHAGPVGEGAAHCGIHLKVETGMHRLGWQEDQWAAAGRRCAQLNVTMASVYSHLSAADDPQQDAHSRKQMQRFEAACAKIAEGWTAVHPEHRPPDFLRHLVNTAGAARFPEAHHDLIRIGLGLYGLDASGSVDGLQPIGTFRSAVSHLHVVPAGEPVGYGAHATADQARTIATIPVGYADGLPRAAGNGAAHLHLGGTLRPIVGPVCMDSCMVDATGLDVRRGSSVEIFGDHAPIHALAEATGTIAYELLCRIPQRVRRRHLRT